MVVGGSYRLEDAEVCRAGVLVVLRAGGSLLAPWRRQWWIEGACREHGLPESAEASSGALQLFGGSDAFAQGSATEDHLGGGLHEAAV